MSELALSDRQREILILIADGKTTAEIGKILGISYYTACGNKNRLMEKFDVYKETALIAAAFRRGVLS